MQLFQNYLFTKSIGVGTIFLYLMLILFISHLRILSLMFQFDKGYLWRHTFYLRVVLIKKWSATKSYFEVCYTFQDSKFPNQNRLQRLFYMDRNVDRWFIPVYCSLSPLGARFEYCPSRVTVFRFCSFWFSVWQRLFHSFVMT